MRRLILFLVVLCWVGAGCAQDRVDKAPNIVYGREACSECRMIIGEKKFSAALVDAAGEIYKFDDIGCAQRYVDKNATMVKRLWVRDYVSENWVDGQKAYFLVADSFVTPMGHGVVAFETESKAHDLLEQNPGKLVSWEKMRGSLLNDIDPIRGGRSDEGK